ncbi:hypothetical protein HI914_07261 [Erysiphe necator]|nr:hypothetical protein HI914_07261 [Erysiphe necator]
MEVKCAQPSAGMTQRRSCIAVDVDECYALGGSSCAHLVNTKATSHYFTPNLVQFRTSAPEIADDAGSSRSHPSYIACVGVIALAAYIIIN